MGLGLYIYIYDYGIIGSHHSEQDNYYGPIVEPISSSQGPVCGAGQGPVCGAGQGPVCGAKDQYVEPVKDQYVEPVNCQADILHESCRSSRQQGEQIMAHSRSIYGT